MLGGLIVLRELGRLHTSPTLAAEDQAASPSSAEALPSLWTTARLLLIVELT